MHMDFWLFFSVVKKQVQETVDKPGSETEPV